MNTPVHVFLWLLIAAFLSFNCIQNASAALSIHVLDTDIGGNAANMECKLSRLDDADNFVQLSTARTDEMGRIAEFLPAENYTLGIYQIWFDTKNYFNARNTSTFYPFVQLTYEVTDPERDSHIPLILSPYGFTTYRGS